MRLHVVIIAAMLGRIWAVDLGTYKGCAATDADFEMSPLTATSGVLKLAFDDKGGGLTDVYFIEKGGNFKKYDASARKVLTLGKITVPTGVEDGLVGVALDPNFKSNRNVFFMYSFLSEDKTTESTFRISRIPLGVNGNLDLATEKVLIKIPSRRNLYHTAGSMQFDAYGDLWVAIGDNESLDWGPANTSDLRGGIIRIHPDGSPRGYTIPKGNFGEAIAARFQKQGMGAMAALYSDTSKVRPEIYVKGTRNAYTLTLDPVRRWLAWGDVGPDQHKISEEYNLVKEPYYMGWPYFAGEEDMAGVDPYNYHLGRNPISAGSTRLAPINKNDSTRGVKQLPPIREPIFKRLEGCAMTGPIFRYDGSNPSASQFPPQFNRKWLVSGCDNYGFHLLTLNEAGDSVTSEVKIFSGNATNTMVDMKQGPDGAVYIANYNAGIDVIRYTGTCKDPSLLPEMPTAIAAPDARIRPLKELMTLDRQSLSVLTEGPHEVRILDLQGREAVSFRGSGPTSYALPALSAKGVFRILIRTESGSASAEMVRF